MKHIQNLFTLLFIALAIGATACSSKTPKQDEQPGTIAQPAAAPAADASLGASSAGRSR